jgi:hypothetical protein
MMPKKTGIHSLENLVRMHGPSTASVRQAAGHVGGGGQVGGDGNMSTDAAHPPSDTLLKRSVGEPSAPHGSPPEEDAEYEEVDDLIYERTGTLSFPYRSPLVESSARASEARGAGPEATAALSVGPEPSAWSTLGHLVRDLRAASADTPGVSLLATVDVVSTPRASMAPRFVPQPVLVAPAVSPPRRKSVVANRALSKVAQTIVASSSPASRPSGPSRGREPQSLAPAPTAQRTTRPSLRSKQHARQLYPSFGQRVRAEVRRIPLAKRSLALGGVAALVFAGALLASSALMPRNVPADRAATHSSVAPVVDQRAPLAERRSEKRVVSRDSAAALVDERGPASALADVVPRVSVVVAEEYDEVMPEPPAGDAQLTGERSKGAEATARSNRRAPTPPRPHRPCDCFAGDPLCGCLD